MARNGLEATSPRFAACMSSTPAFQRDSGLVFCGYQSYSPCTSVIPASLSNTARYSWPCCFRAGGWNAGTSSEHNRGGHQCRCGWFCWRAALRQQVAFSDVTPAWWLLLERGGRGAVRSSFGNEIPYWGARKQQSEVSVLGLTMQYDASRSFCGFDTAVALLKLQHDARGG